MLDIQCKFCYYHIAFGLSENLTLTGKVVLTVSVVKVGENESLESALKRFKRKCQKDNILGDLRKKECYEKPSVRRKKKSEAARKRGKN